MARDAEMCASTVGPRGQTRLAEVTRDERVGQVVAPLTPPADDVFGRHEDAPIARRYAATSTAREAIERALRG